MPDHGIRVITTQAVLRELATAASVHIRHARPDASPDILTIGPVTVDRLARFFVVATLILGGADALMLSAIAEISAIDGDMLLVRFPGWETL